MSINEVEICSRCKSKDSIITDYENGELVCNQCGLVYEERIIVDEDEQRTFADDNGHNQIHRVGPPEKPSFGNECGTNLLIRDKGKTKVIKTYSKFTKIQKNFIRIDKFLSSYDITGILREETKELYCKLAKNMNMQGRNLNHIFIGIYYYVSRKLNMARTIKEIALKFNVTERVIKRAFNSIKRDIVEPPKEDDNNEIIETEKNHIRTFMEANANANAYEVKMVAFDIIKNINKNELLEGKSPKTVSGLSLLIAYELSNDNSYDKKELYAFFSNKNTLKKADEEIKDKLQIIVPQELWDKINSLNIF